jgi:hypothetical protein
MASGSKAKASGVLQSSGSQGRSLIIADDEEINEHVREARPLQLKREGRGRMRAKGKKKQRKLKREGGEGKARGIWATTRMSEIDRTLGV